MTTDDTTRTTFSAELYLRGDSSGLLGGAAIRRRAERLAANGAFSDGIVTSRWQYHRTPAEDWSNEAMETYRAFQAWADENGFSLEPGFQRRTRSFIGMDGTEEVVVFPYVALAIYADDELAAVFPCTDEDRTYTVESALEAFERGDESWLTQFDSVGTADGVRVDASVAAD